MIAKRGPQRHVRGPVSSREEEISERMSGNLCRCGAYVGIRAAILTLFSLEWCLERFHLSRAGTSQEG